MCNTIYLLINYLILTTKCNKEHLLLLIQDVFNKNMDFGSVYKEIAVNLEIESPLIINNSYNY